MLPTPSMIFKFLFLKNDLLEYYSNAGRFVLQLAIIMVIGFILFRLPFIIAKYRRNFLKSAVYECGFAPFQTAKIKFNIQYYVIAILFLLFDLEIVLLFPWSILLSHLTLLGFINGCFFLVLLLFGVYFEFRSGVFELLIYSADVSKKTIPTVYYREKKK